MVGRIERNADGLFVKYGSSEGWKAVGGEIANTGPFGIFKIHLNKSAHQEEFWNNTRLVALGGKLSSDWVINEIEIFFEEPGTANDNVDISLVDEQGNVISLITSFSTNQPVGTVLTVGPMVIGSDALIRLAITDNNPSDTSGKFDITFKYTV